MKARREDPHNAEERLRKEEHEKDSDQENAFGHALLRIRDCIIEVQVAESPGTVAASGRLSLAYGGLLRSVGVLHQFASGV